MMSQENRQLEEFTNQQRSSLVSEFIYFMKHHKKWWLTPILIVIAIIGILAVLAGSGVAPMIYLG